MVADDITLKELQSKNKDLEWFSNNFLELKEKYPKKFVAIKNQNVVIATNKLETLLNYLKQKFGNPNDFLIDFIPDDKYVLVVWF